MSELIRRGFKLGPTPKGCGQNIATAASPEELRQSWQQGISVHLPTVFEHDKNQNLKHIQDASHLFQNLLEGEPLDDLLDQQPYSSRLQSEFDCLGSSINPSNEQEIETVFFDAISGNETEQDLWVKASWLSFSEDDFSLRFRFSFGVDFEEDVAADPVRQSLAANLADMVFPESVVATQNQQLNSLLQNTFECNSLTFVERIIYFNSPNGGAYLHHDHERGHAGVLYVQLTGQTVWLALPEYKLIDEIVLFVQACKKNNCWPDNLNDEQIANLLGHTCSRSSLKDALLSFTDSSLIHLINETKEFVQHLIERGFAVVLTSGDGILLPQNGFTSSEKNQPLITNSKCWHSVFCLGEQAGQGLSFAIRAD